MSGSQWVCRECQAVFPEYRKALYCTCGEMLALYPCKNAQNQEIIHQGNLPSSSLQPALSAQKDVKEWWDLLHEEGFTPLAKLDNDNEHIYLKLEYQSPEKSYLERCSTLLVSKLKQQKIKKIVLAEANYVNLSITRKAKLVSIPCELYLPKGCSPHLFNEFKNEGVNIHHSTFQHEASEEDRYLFIAGDTHPYLTEGAKAFVYELWRQLGDREPDIIVLPIENVLLIQGAYYGFQTLLEYNIIKKIPKFIIVETISALKENSISPSLNKEVKMITNQTDGHIQPIPISAVIQAEKALQIRGHQVDRQSAAAYAGCMRYYRDQSMKNETIIIPLNYMMADGKEDIGDDGVKNGQ